MNVTFSSGGANYTATDRDIFMDNGARIVFIKNGKQADPAEWRIVLSAREWLRIKPHLNAIDYEQYYGRKPLLPGINIYQVKK